MWLDNGTPLCAPQFPNIQDGGTGHPPLRPSREHRASRTREAPSVRARDPAPVPFGEPFTRSLQSQGGPCQAAVPSPYNLIVFPRLRSITRGRAKTRLLKGQRPRPAGGEGVPSCPPPPYLRYLPQGGKALGKERLLRQHSALRAPTPRLCGPGPAA